MDPHLANNFNADALAQRKAPYRSRPVQVQVEIADRAQTIDTLESAVPCQPGDAILTGGQGERWPVPAAQFRQKYQPAPGQADGVSGRYTKRVTEVQAAQLHAALQVPLSDGRGALSGQAGDWCVWYSPTDRAIVAADLFATLYEADAVSVYVQLGRALSVPQRQSALAALHALALVMPHTRVVFTEEATLAPETQPVWFRIVKEPPADSATLAPVTEVGLDAIAGPGPADLAARVRAAVAPESAWAYSLRQWRATWLAQAPESAADGLLAVLVRQLAAVEFFNARLQDEIGQPTPWPFVEQRNEAAEPAGLKKLLAIGAVADQLASRYQSLWQKLVLATTADIAAGSLRKLLRRPHQTLIGLGLLAALMLAAFSELGGGCDPADPLGFSWCGSAWWAHGAGGIFFGAYLLALAAAWRRYASAKAGLWEARHQDCRLLAECLRVLYVRAVLGTPACVADGLPVAAPADSGWVVLALRSVYLDVCLAGLSSSADAPARVAQALRSFVAPQLAYHENQLLRQRTLALQHLSRLAQRGLGLFALMVLTLLAHVLGSLSGHALLSAMAQHLVLLGLVLGLGSWGAMRKVMDSFGLEQEVQRGRLVLSALARARAAGSSEAILQAADDFLEDQAHWHALHRSQPIEATTGG